MMAMIRLLESMFRKGCEQHLCPRLLLVVAIQAAESLQGIRVEGEFPVVRGILRV
jgi:hypothetical protein